MTRDGLPSPLTPRERAAELLSRMTRLEKAQQLSALMPISLYGAQGIDADRCKLLLGNGIGHISALGNLTHKAPADLAAATNAIQHHLVADTRLGIPAIIHNEALNGLMAAGHDQFPTPIAQASTWNPGLIERMAALTARQMRAVGVHQALAPVLDVARDARWGRVHETWGEDPYLISAFAVAFTRGLQGGDLREGAIATGKHFLGYALGEGGQNTASTHLGRRELLDVFARPFEAAIREAGLRSVMNSYSAVDGEPVGASRALLTDLLRGQLGFSGTVVSDYGTVSGFVERQLIAATREQAGAIGVAAGLDVELPFAYGYGAHLLDAIDQGLLAVEQLDAAALRVLTAKFELGLFDQPYVREDAAELRTLPGSGRELSLEIARQAVTLLKNDDDVLPLAPGIPQTIAVIGPHADSTAVGYPAYTFPAALDLLAVLSARDGGMAGLDHTPEGLRHAARELAPHVHLGAEAYVRAHYPAESFLEAVRRLAPAAEIRHAPGCRVLEPIDGGVGAAVRASRGADVILLVLGGVGGWFGEAYTEGEGNDSAEISLPVPQQQLIRAVAELGIPLVGVLHQGRPLALTGVAELFDALIALPYAAESTGRAAAEAVFGLINPSGKLPVSMPRHAGQIPIYHYQHTGSGYRRTDADLYTGYRDTPSTPLFPFGHGLSYTSFEYENLSVTTPLVRTDGEIELEFSLGNSGYTPGTETVQLYAFQPVTGLCRPARQLLGFARVRLEPYETARVRFTVPMSLLAHTGLDGRLAVEASPVTLYLGSSSEDLRLCAHVEVGGPRRDLDREQRAFFSAARVSH